MCLSLAKCNSVCRGNILAISCASANDSHVESRPRPTRDSSHSGHVTVYCQLRNELCRNRANTA